MFIGAALLIGAVSLISCGEQSPEAGAKDYFVRTTYDREGDCDSPDSMCAKVDFIFPAPTPKMPQPLAQAFEGAVRELIVTPSVNGRPEGYDTLSITQLSQYIMSQFEQMQADFPDAASTRRLFEEQLVAVVGDTLGMITLKRTARAFTGGAHENEVVTLMMLDRATGERLTLNQ
ncbi:MAG TPA: hypothetical protein VLB27_07865, partial [candidate division Zixibacteria bacterium]|nr:hypothetical protein [candidate division Zixibacteria bacterium]